ncbi:hypothetical protein ACFL6G_00610 [candidate division KSB1 bacterium]
MTGTGNEKAWVMRLFIVLILVTGLTGGVSFSQTTSNNYAILIGGLGGGTEYKEKFRQYLLDTWQIFTRDFKFPQENVIVLSGAGPEDESFINDVSTKENIEKYFSDFANRISDGDNLFVILFGHGSYDGKNAKLNIPRMDLTDEEYGGLLDRIKASRIVFVNTASASAPFIQHISAPGRIVITATKSGTQRNQPLFSGYFVEALKNAGADLDKNGNLSVLEVFKYASEKTFRWYEENNHLATEHPQIEDTGDKKSFRDSELIDTTEGNLAEITFFKNSLLILTENEEAQGDSVLIGLLREKAETEMKIAELKNEKSTLTEEEYFSRLEKLLLDLARINEEIEKRKGKG